MNGISLPIILIQTTELFALYGSWTNNNILLSETAGNASENEIATVTIQQTKHALYTWRNFVESATGTDDGAFSALSNFEHTVGDRSDKNQTLTLFPLRSGITRVRCILNTYSDVFAFKYFYSNTLRVAG